MNRLVQKIQFKKKVIVENRSSFLERLAVLLNEGYTFHDSLFLLLPHHMKDYRGMQEKIEEDFRSGLGVTHILGRFGFSPGLLLPVAIAEIDGKLAEALLGMAVRLRSLDEKRKKLKSLLLYPMVLFVFIVGLLLVFRKFFLPNMEALAMSRQSEAKGFVAVLPAIVARIPDIMFVLVLITLGVTTICIYLYRKLTPERKIRVWLSIPLGGMLFSIWKTRDFAGEMGNLLQSGLSMQNALSVLIDQQLDPVLSEIAENVREQVIYGEPFHSAVELTDGLTEQLAAFAEHGADSGHLPKELIIYSDHLGETIDRKLNATLSILQPALFSIIAICILAAYLAILLPVYGMLDKL